MNFLLTSSAFDHEGTIPTLSKQDLAESMHGHVLADAVLMGTYIREQ